MIVTPENFENCLASLERQDVLAVDTEGTGLRPYHGDTPFSIIVGHDKTAYYFNFQDYGDGSPVLSSQHAKALGALFAQDKVWMLHNAKYDLAMLKEHFGFTFGGKIHCTMAVERVVNDIAHHRDFSLEYTARRYGFEKSKEVEQYVSKHGLETKISVPGKKRVKALPHYDQVPFDIIAPYGEQDAFITFGIGQEQCRKIEERDARRVDGQPSLKKLYDNECELVRTVYEMERRGVKIDSDFCREAVRHEQGIMREAVKFWETETGHPFKASNKLYQEVFASEKERWQYTENKNPSFTAEVLETFTSPLAKAVVAYNQAKSRANNYLGFIEHSDEAGILHTNLNQHVARTGRFSSSNPNLQNLKKDGEEDLLKEFVVRRAIAPRKTGNFLGMIDYDQIEYRLMIDYCAPLNLIYKIMNEGLDVHQATADSAGLTRARAKTVNFGILYGMGDKALAESLKVSTSEARAIKQRIFSAAPEIERFIYSVIRRAETRGYIYNWLGRILHYDRRTSYKAPNGLIQGGAADIIKVAMNRCEAFLEPYETKLILTIHDELVFEGPRHELPVLLKLKEIMEGVYPWTNLPLTAGIDVSFKSLADKVPYEEAI